MKTTYYTFLASILVIATLVGNTAFSKETPITAQTSKLVSKTIIKPVKKSPETLKASVARVAAPGGGGEPGGGDSGGGAVTPSANETIHIGLGAFDSITPETTDLLGEQIDLNTGALSFSQVDAQINGNSSIPVQISRVMKGNSFSYYNNQDFGDWALDIPHIRTTSVQSGRIAGTWGEGKECSGEPDNEALFGVAASEYYNGEHIHVPGIISENILYKGKKTTKSNWKITCIKQGSGEAFSATSPQGHTYTFAHKTAINDGHIRNRFGSVQRIIIYMLVTKVTDKFGNYVNYNYGSQGLLSSISASDGRTITIQRDLPSPNQQLITSINVNGRVWKYAYTNYATKTLDTVTKPDGKKWQYDLADFSATKYLKSICSIPNRQTTIGTITHPNGVKGTYTTQAVLRGKTHVPKVFHRNLIFIIQKNAINRWH